MQGPGLSIGLVVRNEALQIRECLDRIKLAVQSDPCELIVIDNNSTDMTFSILNEWKEKNPQIPTVLIRRKKNHMAEARNQVLHSAQSPWVYFTDADCRLQPEAWAKLLHLSSTEKEKVAFGGGNRTPEAMSFVSQGLIEMSHNWWGHMGAIQIKPPTDFTKTALLSTCNFLVKKSVALSCGGFDRAFARVGEDLSLSHRLKAFGHDLYAVPGIEVTHLQDRGLWQWCRKIFFYGQAQVHVAVKYPRHFLGLRGLQFFLVLIFLGMTLLAPFILMAVFAFYLALLASSIFLSAPSSWRRLRGISFIVISHVCYAAGEVSAILTLPFFIFMNFPEKIPSLEKK